MIVSLIPLFFAANITVNATDWKYGPEVIYIAKIDSSTHTLGESEAPKVFNASMKFRCRPKTELSLSCLIDDPEILSGGPSSDSPKNRIPDECSKFENARQGGPFELIFDRTGLLKIIIASEQDAKMIGLFKDLAKQLDFGAYLTNVPLNMFGISENTTTGGCNRIYFKSSGKLGADDPRRSKKTPYEIVVVPKTMVPRGLEERIVETKRMEECLHRYNYYDQDWKDITLMAKKGKELPKMYYEKEFISSYRQITVTENDFASYTEEIMTIVDKVNKFAAVERNKQTTISLYELAPANGPPLKINNPTKRKVLPIRRINTAQSSLIQR